MSWILDHQHFIMDRVNLNIGRIWLCGLADLAKIKPIGLNIISDRYYPFKWNYVLHLMEHW